MVEARPGLTALILDDDEFFRMALAQILKTLGFTTIAEAASLSEATDAAAGLEEIDIALFDLAVPGMEGPATLRAVREWMPARKLAVVSASSSRADILSSLDAGAHGYISKAQGVQTLQNALRQILAGRLYVPPSLAEIGPDADDLRAQTPENSRESDVRLSPRQRDVLDLLVRGNSNKEIARALGLGAGTVKVHLAAVFRALGVNNRASAAVAGASLLRSRSAEYRIGSRMSELERRAG